MTKEELTAYILTQYGVEPDYPWVSEPEFAVFRHRENRKWFALLMNVGRDRLGLNGDGIVDVVNVKCDPLMLGSARMNEGVLPGYHMNRGHWLSVLLDGTADSETVTALVDMSYALTRPKPKKKK